ncbi:hypothetical protein HDV62DRAFT_257749 [Trichoderma sp. SZMC 28011]
MDLAGREKAGLTPPTLPFGRWRHLQGGLCLILLSGLDLTMLEHSRLPTHLHPFLELALCGQCLLFYFLGLAISQSTTIAAFCVKRRKLSNCLIYSFSHQCYESDRMYEQWGFTPPSLPLPYTRGSLILNWHAIYSPCSGSFSLRDKNLFCFPPSWGEREL